MAPILALVLFLSASPLIDAVKQGDVQAVRALIKSGADVINLKATARPPSIGPPIAILRSSFGLLLDAGAAARAANDLASRPCTSLRRTATRPS